MNIDMTNKKPTDKELKDKELIIQLHMQSCNESIYWNSMANDRSNEVSRQLINIAAISIPLTGTILASNEHMTPVLGVLLAVGLLSLLASIVCGLKQLIEGGEFFKKYMDKNTERAAILYTYRNRPLDEALAAADEKHRKNILAEVSNSSYGDMQYWTIGIGLLIISGVVVALAFLSSNQNQPTRYKSPAHRQLMTR